MSLVNLDARKIQGTRKVTLAVAAAVTPSGVVDQAKDGVYDLVADAPIAIAIEASAPGTNGVPALTLANGYLIPMAGTPLKFVVPSGYQIYAITATVGNLFYQRIGDAA